jgi:hypothetical protein
MGLINKNMAILKFSICLFLVGLFTACTSTDKKIIKYVQSVCINGEDTCRIDLRQVLNVDYDSMYLFGEYTPDSEISLALRQEYVSNKTIADSKDRIILLKNNKIVYEDDFSTRFLAFVPITESLESANKNWTYLVHYSPYYIITKYTDNYGKDYYWIEEISNNTQYSIE